MAKVCRASIKSAKEQSDVSSRFSRARDIEAEVSDLDNAYLYTVDDLQHIVEQNIATRQSAAEAAEQMIAEQSKAYDAWRQSRESINLVRNYRDRSQSQAEQR